MEKKLEQKILKAKKEKRVALIPFLPAGYPNKDKFWEILFDLDAGGADIIEIGVPFSDPTADGPVVEQASQTALAEGASLEWIFKELPEKEKSLNADLLLMGYMNPFMQFGWERLEKMAAQTKISGLIVPDLPLEESKRIKDSFANGVLEIIPLIGLNTSQKRMHLYAQEKSSFVYFVSVLGTTGVRSALPQELKSSLSQARELFSQPLALGFGLSQPEQLKELRDYVDAAVFGSSLIRHIQAGKEVSEFMKVWKG